MSHCRPYLGLANEDPVRQSSVADGDVVEQGAALEIQPIRSLAKPPSLVLSQLDGCRARVFDQGQEQQEILHPTR